jgi:hypothetical protein
VRRCVLMLKLMLRLMLKRECWRGIGRASAGQAHASNSIPQSECRGMENENSEEFARNQVVLSVVVVVVVVVSVVAYERPVIAATLLVNLGSTSNTSPTMP